MTQKEKVLNFIQKYGHITSLEAVLKLNIIDLQAIVYSLKKDGVNVLDEWVTNRRTGATYKVYGLNQRKINAYKSLNAKGC